MKHKFGFEKNQEIAAIKSMLISEKDMEPNSIELHFEAEKIYVNNHKNDVPYRDKKVRRVKSNTKSIGLTNEEMVYLKDKLYGVNDPIGLDILEKIYRMIEDD